MNSVVRHQPSKTFNRHHPCPDLASMAERELSAFFHAIVQRFGPEQAKFSAEDWLRELIEMDALPASVHEWRLITAKASSRLASRVRANASSISSSLTSSLSLSLSPSSSLSPSRSTESQIA
jgi:hypothetical protein